MDKLHSSSVGRRIAAVLAFLFLWGFLYGLSMTVSLDYEMIHFSGKYSQVVIPNGTYLGLPFPWEYSCALCTPGSGAPFNRLSFLFLDLLVWGVASFFIVKALEKRQRKNEHPYLVYVMIAVGCLAFSYLFELFSAQLSRIV